MSNVYSISKMMMDVFGIRGYIPPKAKPAKPISGYDGINADERDALRLSKLGTPIYESTTLKFLNERLALPDSTIIDVERAKKIVRTEIQGRNGTVKEYIAMDDYTIRIRGIVAGNASYPESEVKELRRFFEFNKEIEIINETLNIIFEIHKMVITDISLPRMEGSTTMQPFAINAISDEDIELILKKDVRA